MFKEEKKTSLRRRIRSVEPFPIDILVVGRTLSEHLRVPNIKATLINLCKLGVSLTSDRINVYMMSIGDTKPAAKPHFQASGTWTFIDIHADMNRRLCVLPSCPTQITL